MTTELVKTGLQIIVPTKELQHALNFSGSVVEKRNVLNELSNIKLTANNNTLTIGATDIDLYLNQTIGAEVIKEGVTTVSYQTLSDIIRRINDEEIKLVQEQGSEKLELIGKSCKFELLTLAAAKFPALEDVSSDVSVQLECKDLARILEYTSFAMSTEETRYNLNGVYLHIRDGEFRSAATDGHRLSVASSGLKNSNKDFGVIVPKKTVLELHKIVKDTKNINSIINISLGSNKVKFELDNVILISKLIDGTFPEYSSFIPADNDSKLTVKTKILADAIDRVAAITVDKFRAIKLSINEDVLKITASGEAKGAASEQLVYSDKEDAYCKFSGTNLTIGFNPKYISDVLNAIKEDKVELLLKDTQSPVLIKTKENPTDSFVVMPVKV